MAEPLPEADLDTAVDPDGISRQDFEIERRGFDQRQVRAYLIAVAESLRDAQAREADMRMRMGRAVRRAESAEQAASESQASTTDADISRQIGDEVTGVLDAARVAGEQRVAAAESSAQQILKNAKNEAADLRGAAENVLAERSADADIAAAKIVAESEQQAEEIRNQARQDHERARRHAMAMVGKARSESDSLINEAEQARAQILEDMDRRRREARAQVERLRVGRDRLLRSYEVVRRSLDEATNELKISLTEAKVRGDSAARRVLGEPAASRPQLEAEIADARMTGLIRIEGEQQQQGEATAPVAEVSSSPPATSDAVTSEPVVAPQQKTEQPDVPNIDLRTRGSSASTFTERVAPSPSRPRVGVIETNDSAIRVVPKPPAVAPIIRREESVDQAPADEDVVESETAEVTALITEAGVDHDDSEAETIEIADADEVEAVELEVVAVDDAEVEAVELEVVAVDDAEVEAVELEVVAVDDAEVEAVELEVVAVDDAEVELEHEVAEPAVDDATSEVDDTELSAEELDAVFASELPEGELDVVAPQDEIETVVALIEAVDADDDAAKGLIEPEETTAEPVVDEEPAIEVEEQSSAAGGLFAALREQRGADSTSADDDASSAPVAVVDDVAVADDIDAAAAEDESALVAAAADETDPVAELFDFDIDEVFRQRDAVVVESARQLERRLKRALADEQNELLAGLRASKKSVELISLVGDSDSHLSRYVSAIAEVATTAYSAGMALVQTDIESTGSLPAGAVEELLASSIIEPIRRRLEVAGADEPETQLSTVRAFYRQRKTDDLPVVAADLASLLCTAGLCETLPPGTPLPR